MKRVWVITTIAVVTLGLIFGGGTILSSGVASAASESIQWDIVSLNPPDDLTVEPGGTATARDQEGNTITFTGSGTFVVPDEGVSNVVTGGGTWETSDSSGTYEVTGLVSWHVAPGTLPSPPLTFTFGDPADARAGLAVMTIEYSDGSEGVLTVSCKLPTTPPEIAATMCEGITVSKEFVVFWDRDEPALGVDADRTLFQVEAVTAAKLITVPPCVGDYAPTSRAMLLTVVVVLGCYPVGPCF